ncbi:uncharacterized protein J4E88_004200 [Alternaria novae-zelandiae]|uniref:uncharacterized protein n=1 Tax=Alternaria novae-zelandiae TaxID=430562 RepID=UPI0020C43EF7|nr:uncharacterized protein J4E88_004200 [Alternaria novae-zelandiae]KAI4684759.1 hypothetical protein J4E88_004200 [Alternaria novae-zelandiae]
MPATQPSANTAQERNREENSEVELGTESEAESSGAEETDEEDPEALLEEVKADQAKEEAKVKAAAEKLGDKERKVGDIRGKWHLYSAQWVEEYASKKDQDLEDNDWTDGVGSIEFGKHLIVEDFGPYAGNMGMQLEIWGGPVDAQATKFNKPKYTSTLPESVQLFDEGEEDQIYVELRFLGNGYLELHMDGIYFAGILVQDRKAVKRAAEEFDDEWRNCKYTRHTHPSNMLAAFGMPADLEDSDSGSFDESDDEDDDEDGE